MGSLITVTLEEEPKRAFIEHEGAKQVCYRATGHVDDKFAEVIWYPIEEDHFQLQKPFRVQVDDEVIDLAQAEIKIELSRAD